MKKTLSLIILFTVVNFAQGGKFYFYYVAMSDGRVSYESETLAYQSRVEADGGTVINLGHLNDFILDAKTKNYYDSLICACDANWGVKKDANNKVTKLYTLVGIRDYAQTDTSKSPTWLASQLNGYAGIRYDGVNDQLVVTINQIGEPQPYSMFFLIKKASAFTFKNWLDNATTRTIFGAGAGGLLYIYSGTTLNDTSGFPINTNTIFTGVFNGASSQIYKNSVLKITGNANTGRWGRTSIGTEAYSIGSSLTSAWANIVIYNFIAKHGIGNVSNVNVFLNSKYGVY